MMKTPIFISYKRIDKDKVFEIKEYIEVNTGVNCWIDLDGIESDAQFDNVIIRAISECEVMLFMYSKTHSQIVDAEKDWTIKELNFASFKKKRIVFINIDGSTLTDWFGFHYGTKQQVDAKDTTRLDRLVKDLRVWLNIPETKPSTHRLQQGENNTMNRANEKEEMCSLVLQSAEKKFESVKTIMENLHLDLLSAQEIVRNTPIKLPGLFNKEKATRIKYAIEKTGGKVMRVKPEPDTEKTNKKMYKIHLHKYGSNKMQCVKALMDSMDIGEREARSIADALDPASVLHDGVQTLGIFREVDARRIYDALKRAGADLSMW